MKWREDGRACGQGVDKAPYPNATRSEAALHEDPFHQKIKKLAAVIDLLKARRDAFAEELEKIKAACREHHLDPNAIDALHRELRERIERELAAFAAAADQHDGQHPPSSRS